MHNCQCSSICEFKDTVHIVAKYNGQWRILRYTAYTGGIPNFGGLKNIDEMCFFAKESIKILNVSPTNQVRKCYKYYFA